MRIWRPARRRGPGWGWSGVTASHFSRRFDVRIVSFGGQLNLTWKRRIEQIRQRWWVVLVVAVARRARGGGAFAIDASDICGEVDTVCFRGRVPEQDAKMVVGYMTIFNDPATIARLRATTKIPEDVTFEARTVAASPILTIEATADDPKVAQDAAHRHGRGVPRGHQLGPADGN